jgi:hypothetical protein
MSKLNKTIPLMESGDYRQRFIAEYWQTRIRYEKLRAFNRRIEAALRTAHCDPSVRVEMPKHDCPDILLIDQEDTMLRYLNLLEERAIIEKIDLDILPAEA